MQDSGLPQYVEEFMEVANRYRGRFCDRGAGWWGQSWNPGWRSLFSAKLPDRPHYTSCRIGTGFLSRVGEARNRPECEVTFHLHLSAEEKDIALCVSPLNLCALVADTEQM
jgi:hypothetical protein